MPYECLWPVTLCWAITASVVVFWFELVVVINLCVVVISLPCWCPRPDSNRRENLFSSFAVFDWAFLVCSTGLPVFGPYNGQPSSIKHKLKKDKNWWIWITIWAWPVKKSNGACGLFPDSACVFAPFQPGWEERVHTDGRTFYIDHSKITLCIFCLCLVIYVILIFLSHCVIFQCQEKKHWALFLYSATWRVFRTLGLFW